MRPRQFRDAQVGFPLGRSAVSIVSKESLMHTLSVPPSARDRERGQALAFVGIAMMLFVALAVIGIDVGRLAFTAAETQSIADAAATAAAGAIGQHDPNPLSVATAVVEQ